MRPSPSPGGSVVSTGGMGSRRRPAWPLAAVVVVVTGMLLLAAARGRRRTEDEAKGAAAWGEPFIVITGVLVSGAILVGFFVFSLGRMQALADSGRRTKLTVSVIGHDWWWEVRYPN